MFCSGSRLDLYVTAVSTVRSQILSFGKPLHVGLSGIVVLHVWFQDFGEGRGQIEKWLGLLRFSIDDTKNREKEQIL